MTASLLRAVILAGAVVFAATAQLSAALDSAQKQTLATAEGGLKQVETNLKLAQSAAGAGAAAIQGSRARLVQSRLAMAKTPLAQVTELVASLPADDTQVAALKTRLDAAAAAVGAIEARLGQQPAPAAADPATSPPKQAPAKAVPAPAAGPVRLDYKQEQLAKDARSYLAEMEGLAGGTADAVKQIAAVADPRTVDHRLVQAATNSIAKARQRAGLVKSRLDQLPQNGEGVAELTSQYQAAIASLDASDQAIAPLQQKLSALVNPGAYPQLEGDLRRLQQLALMYQEADALLRNCARAAALAGQAPAATAEAQRIAAAYAPLVQQKTPDGERVEKMGQFFRDNFAAFSAAAAQRKQALPAEIDADLAKASQMADQAVTEQKPAFFQGGIPQVVGQAEDKLTLLAALDPAATAAAKAKLAEARSQLKTRESKLRDAIIATNELPPDRYTGKDRAGLEQFATALWKQNEPAAQVLAIRIPSDQWNRDTLLRYENRAWHLIDRSSLQVQLLVKADGGHAVVRPINLSADHLNNNKVTGLPMDDLHDELPPGRYLMIGKIK